MDEALEVRLQSVKNGEPAFTLRNGDEGGLLSVYMFLVVAKIDATNCK